MTDPIKLASVVCYSGSSGSASWRGRLVTDADAFRKYLRERVRARVRDDDAGGPFAAELLGMATTGMSTDFCKKLLASVPPAEAWEIGEALAECVLTDDDTLSVHWPWNLVRDRRTPRASLPGADLVGFCSDATGPMLLFGEVKTSSDANTPPGVMYGGTGMPWQLEDEATNLRIQLSLLQWLRVRCPDGEHLDRYKFATGRYVKSGGKQLTLVGLLMRDTEKNELDVKSRSEHLGKKLVSPTKVEVVAWYLPSKIDKWGDLINEAKD